MMIYYEIFSNSGKCIACFKVKGMPSGKEWYLHLMHGRPTNDINEFNSIIFKQ